MTWRDKAALIIASVIREVGTSDAKALRKALHTDYPFGERRYHSYKIWCDEIRRQLGEKPKTRKAKRLKAEAYINKNQGSLF